MCDLTNVVNSVPYWLVRLLFTKPVSVCEPVQKHILKHITPNTAVPGCLGNTELYFGFQPVNVYQAGIKHLSFVNFCERGGLFCNSFTETG